MVVTSERGLHKAEVTMQFYGHNWLATAPIPILFTALWEALEKLEAQAVKQQRQVAREAAPARSSSPGAGGSPKARSRKTEQMPADKTNLWA